MEHNITNPSPVSLFLPQSTNPLPSLFILCTSCLLYCSGLLVLLAVPVPCHHSYSSRPQPLPHPRCCHHLLCSTPKLILALPIFSLPPLYHAPNADEPYCFYLTGSNTISLPQLCPKHNRLPQHIQFQQVPPLQVGRHLSTHSRYTSPCDLSTAV